jgi:hypothetical protein
MYPIYRDIRDRLGEPLWHDQHGVPRYDEFHPSYLGIYDDWAVLFVVECQACGQRFHCAHGLSSINLCIKSHMGDAAFAFEDKDDPSVVLPHIVGWGDAPWHGTQQCAGTTMSSDVVGILQVWKKESHGWTQVDISLELANRLCGIE